MDAKLVFCHHIKPHQLVQQICVQQICGKKLGAFCCGRIFLGDFLGFGKERSEMNKSRKARHGVGCGVFGWAKDASRLGSFFSEIRDFFVRTGWACWARERLMISRLRISHVGSERRHPQILPITCMLNLFICFLPGFFRETLQFLDAGESWTSLGEDWL